MQNHVWQLIRTMTEMTPMHTQLMLGLHSMLTKSITDDYRNKYKLKLLQQNQELERKNYSVSILVKKLFLQQANDTSLHNLRLRWW